MFFHAHTHTFAINRFMCRLYKLYTVHACSALIGGIHTILCVSAEYTVYSQCGGIWLGDQAVPPYALSFGH